MTTWHKVLVGEPIRATPCSGVLKEITHFPRRAPNRLVRPHFYPRQPTDHARTWVTPQPPRRPARTTRARERTAELPEDPQNRGEAGQPANQRTPPIVMIDGVRCGRCRIRTYVGFHRQIYSLLPLAARAICLVRRFRCAEQLTTNPHPQCKPPAQRPCEHGRRGHTGTTVSVAGTPVGPPVGRP